MKDDLIDRALNRPKGRQHVSENTNEKARYAPVDESDWAWIIEVFDKGKWSTLYGPTPTEDGVRSKTPSDPNIKYRIRGSAFLGKVLKELIAKQEEEARNKKR